MIGWTWFVMLTELTYIQKICGNDKSQSVACSIGAFALK